MKYLKPTDVCPLPPWGVNNGRTIGSVNTYMCGKGTTGGGTATCLPNKQWDKEITPTCTGQFIFYIYLILTINSSLF